jgi:ankyrin repeat protein
MRMRRVVPTTTVARHSTLHVNAVISKVFFGLVFYRLFTYYIILFYLFIYLYYHVILLNRKIVAKFLIESGADINFQDSFGTTPLASALVHARTEVILNVITTDYFDCFIRNNNI